MSEGERGAGAGVAGVVAIAATYVYFLLFAEFAFLGLVQRIVATPAGMKLVMGVLAGGGVAGSGAAAVWFRAERFTRSLAGGFAACAVAAAGALAASSNAMLIVAAALVGLALGWTTVTLASGLRAAVGTARLGWWCGVGTGVAYAVCNVPAVFDASPVTQTVGAIGVVMVGGVATRWIRVSGALVETRGEFAPRAVVAWLGLLLALVWLDSAAFYVIQHAPGLKAATWVGTWRLVGNAATHLVLAIVAGWALDRGGAGKLAALAGALLVAACAIFGSVLAPVFYTAGVSVYSTVLVFYPARSARPGVAALIYAVAGWGGSALGIGMAQDLNAVPGWFLAAAGAAMLAALGVRWRVLAGALAVMAVAAPPRAAAEDVQVLRGREVYVSEGCIHCHSQFVRPRVSADVERWGPARTLEAVLAERPPLPGNRRQGPDLAEVGNRRTAEWQRLHLKNPRAVVPGSRMPAYDYLFRGDGERGEALVAYLASLGRETLAARWAVTERWRPEKTAAEVKPGKAERLFATLCAGCHGATGRGDGPLAAELSLKPPDFTRDGWRRVKAGDAWGVERIVKFGVPGTPMAGHEYLADVDVVALAEFVRGLQGGPTQR